MPKTEDRKKKMLIIQPMSIWDNNLNTLTLITGIHRWHLKSVAEGLNASAGKYRDDHRTGLPWKDCPKFVYVMMVSELQDGVFRHSHSWVSPGHGTPQSINPLYVDTNGEVHVNRSSQGSLSLNESDALVRGETVSKTVVFTDSMADRVDTFALPTRMFIEALTKTE